ncbi:hypothetical protein GCM10023264_25350 [Sphingomonas daechungensis]
MLPRSDSRSDLWPGNHQSLCGKDTYRFTVGCARDLVTLARRQLRLQELTGADDPGYDLHTEVASKLPVNAKALRT